MSYEFNPLLPDGFQKKSTVTPADISRVESEISDLQSTTTDLKQKKVTKFFSANDYLEDNEIAQYQGEDDAVNNLTNGFFYKKNPAFTITPNSDTFAYNVNQKLKIYNFDGTFFEQYYLGQQNLSTSDYSVIGLNDESIFTVRFNPALFVNSSLPATPTGNMIFYPYLNVNGVWDFSNPVSVSDGNYYYKGNRINLVQLRAGLIGATVGADMTSPYNRFLWVSILFSHYEAVFAFPYATNNNNELIALGVSNGLGAFGFQSRLTISSIAHATINVQGVDLTANQQFSLCKQPAVYMPSYADVKYGDDIHYLQFYKNGLGLMIRGNPDQTKTVQIANVSTKYSGLIPITEYYSDIQTAITYKYDGQTDKIIFSTAVSWPTTTVICANDNIITEIDKEDITIN